jgi:ABC-type nitrate/sulfonate/bicarbonate transport system substrate-binding protein
MPNVRNVFQLVALLLLILVSQVANAQGSRSLYVSYGAVDADQLPLWFAKETGIFRNNGLDVALVYFTGGATRIMALISGDAPITQGSGPAAVASNLRGSDAVLIAGGDRHAGFLADESPRD